MTFDEFKTKWNGKGIDFDGAYGDQCMDLMHQYCVEVLGITDGRVLAAPAAKDVWNTPVFGKDKFEAIPNSPTGVPQKGDIVLFGTEIGQYGHVAIVQSATLDKVTSFDQNWNGHQYCETITHSYGGSQGILGWLRFKGQPTGTEMYNGYDLSNRESMKVAVDVLVRLQKGELIDKSKYDADIKKQKDTIDNLNQQISDRNNDIVALNSRISTLDAQVLDLTTQLETAAAQAILVPDLKKENEALTEKVSSYVEAEKSWNRAKGQYEKQIADFKKNALSAAIKEILRRFGIGN